VTRATGRLPPLSSSRTSANKRFNSLSRLCNTQPEGPVRFHLVSGGSNLGRAGVAYLPVERKNQIPRALSPPPVPEQSRQYPFQVFRPHLNLHSVSAARGADDAALPGLLRDLSQASLDYVASGGVRRVDLCALATL